jgi:hypothetical protein
MKNTLLSAIVAVIACGCDGGAFETVDMEQDHLEAAGSSDLAAKRPVGSFRSQGAAVGQFSLLVLKSDMTFHRETVVACLRAPCPAIALDGTYVYSLSGATRYVRFTSPDGAFVDRYAYRLLDDTTLEVRRSGTGEWQTLKDEFTGWCAEVADCAPQDLRRPMCIEGQWTCQASVCAYACGPLPVTPCEQAGGSCVASADGADPCADAILGDRNSCAARAGTMCCLPRRATTCEPVCQSGELGDGWYDSCTSELICASSCEHGRRATCGAITTRSEGWYSPLQAQGCVGALIGWSNCSK